MALWGHVFWLTLVPALVVALVAWPASRWLTHRGMVDQPEPARRMHQVATPRGGGIVICLGLVLSLGIQGIYAGTALVWLTAGGYALLLALVGFWEDVRPRPVAPRLVAQCLLGVLLIVALGPIDAISVQGIQWPHAWLWAGLGWVGLVWLMNLHNFMDGSDGLAASQGVWTAACYALLFYQDAQLQWMGISLSLMGACLGFLVWNRPVARLFMGDSGSLLLGGLVGLLAYQAVLSQAASLVVCVMISSVFVVDATATLIRRVLQGERWYTAHATHAFQRLIAGGLSHSQVLMMYVLLNLGLVLPLVYAAVRYPRYEGWLSLALLSALQLGWWQVQKAHLNQG